MLEILAVISSLSIGCLALFYRSRQLRRAQRLLQKAKEEARDIAALSLNNPHCVLQISENIEVIYTNPATQSSFPDLQERALNHPVLNNLDRYLDEDKQTSRDVEIYGNFGKFRKFSEIFRNVHENFKMNKIELSENAKNEVLLLE